MIENYVTNMVGTYEQAVLNVQNATMSKSNAEWEYRVEKQRYEYGKTSLLELQKKELLCKKAEIDMVQCLIHKVELGYIIKNNIYGVTLE